MNARFISLVILALVFTTIGLLSGWYGAAGFGGGSLPDQGHGGEPGTAAQGAAPALSPQTLKNMGVRTTPAELTSFVRYRPIASVVSATPNYLQDVYAPIAGRIQTVNARYGTRVESGDLLATMVRDPIPRVELILTGDVLKPVSENLHESMSDLRRASISVEILEKELERLRAFTSGDESLPILPAKEIIQVEYDLMQAERELSIVLDELERHGLSPDQIDEIEGGGIPAVDASIWLGALKHNGFWTPLAQNIYAALPADARNSSWTVATIAELVAGDLVDESLIEWIGEDGCASKRFLEIGGLLQRGYDLEYMKELCALGALNPLVEIRAPGSAPDWDVRDLHVKPGEHVEGREPLLTLENPRCLYLRAEPTDSEIETVIGAIESKAEMAARPLVPGTGPDLERLRIRRVYSNGSGRTNALLPLENTPMSSHEDPEGRVYRSWHLREGQRYEIRVPLEVFEQVYVFPSGAVVEDGGDRVVFLKSGDGFRKVAVEVLHQDHEVAVIPAASAVFPGNPIVTSGAFALSLALRAGGDDSDDGHGHAH